VQRKIGGSSGGLATIGTQKSVDLDSLAYSGTMSAFGDVPGSLSHRSAPDATSAKQTPFAQVIDLGAALRKAIDEPSSDEIPVAEHAQPPLVASSANSDVTVLPQGSPDTTDRPSVSARAADGAAEVDGRASPTELSSSRERTVLPMARSPDPLDPSSPSGLSPGLSPNRSLPSLPPSPGRPQGLPRPESNDSSDGTSGKRVQDDSDGNGGNRRTQDVLLSVLMREVPAQLEVPAAQLDLEREVTQSPAAAHGLESCTPASWSAAHPEGGGELQAPVSAALLDVGPSLQLRASEMGPQFNS